MHEIRGQNSTLPNGLVLLTLDSFQSLSGYMKTLLMIFFLFAHYLMGTVKSWFRSRLDRRSMGTVKQPGIDNHHRMRCSVGLNWIEPSDKS